MLTPEWPFKIPGIVGKQHRLAWSPLVMNGAPDSPSAYHRVLRRVETRLALGVQLVPHISNRCSEALTRVPFA